MRKNVYLALVISKHLGKNKLEDLLKNMFDAEAMEH